MALFGGNKAIRLTDGETWTKGDTSGIKMDVIDHIDVRVSSDLSITYGNVYDSAGVKITDPVTVSYDPIRFEANITAITVNSGEIFLVKA